MSQPTFSDNIWVKRARAPHFVSEWFALSLAPVEDHHPYEVSIRRYCTPGRISTYGFDYQCSPGLGVGPRLRYHAEPWMAIGKVAAMVAADLDKPQVVELFARAFATEATVLCYQRDTLKLLGILGPQSAAYRAVKRVCEQTMKARVKRFKTATPS